MREMKLAKGVTVKKGQIVVAVLAALAVAATGAGVAADAAAVVKKPVAFKASLKGKAVVIVSGEQATINSATATGTSVPLGKVTLSGRGAGLQSEPCPLFSGPGTIGTAKGKLKFTISNGSACTDEGGQDFSILARAKIAGGTGKYLKAKGSFKVTGSYNRGTGAFSVKLTGSYTL